MGGLLELCLTNVWAVVAGLESLLMIATEMDSRRAQCLSSCCGCLLFPLMARRDTLGGLAGFFTDCITHPKP